MRAKEYSISRRHCLLGGAAGLAGLDSYAAMAGTHAPVPFGAIPSDRQFRWHQLETYGFVHFTINTFTDREWGYGDESPSLFNPTDFSADQIAETASAGGLKALMLTAKHHDGFCLWPSAYTEHSVKNSPYMQGKGDIVKDLSQACARRGLKFGVYLSPWDRNHADYGRPAYVTYYHKQLEELTTRYGPLFEVWFDGANGGDGYYGGARERRKIDGATYYQWETVRDIVRRNQPQAVMFADAHMDIRWVGNEEGLAGDPCWPTVDDTPFTRLKGNQGVRNGAVWNPAETDVSIRPGWFWHADEAPRSAANLLRLYFQSVGRGSNLLLNLAPDRRGRIPPEDARELTAFRDLRDRTFAINLAQGARVRASTSASKIYAASQLTSDTGFWAAKPNDQSGAWVEIDLPKPCTFDVVRMAEDIRRGVRIDTFAIDILHQGQWTEIARHQCIGYKRLIPLMEPVTTDRVRVRFIKADASPVVGQFGLFLRPSLVEAPEINRDIAGYVTLTAATAGARIHFTTDGSDPTLASPIYDKAFRLEDGGVVQAMAHLPSTHAVSAISVREFDRSSASWRLLTPEETPFPAGPFIGKSGEPYELVVDLAQDFALKGIWLAPGAVDSLKGEGPPAGYRVWVSTDGQAWGQPVAEGEFSNIANNRAIQKVPFTAKGRFIRLRLPNPIADKTTIAFQSFGVTTR